MLYLSKVLDAKLLLFLNQLEVRADVAENLESAIAQFPERNLMFLNDAFAAWRRHAGRPANVESVGLATLGATASIASNLLYWKKDPPAF